jgi:hypothetical protein
MKIDWISEHYLSFRLNITSDISAISALSSHLALSLTFLIGPIPLIAMTSRQYFEKQDLQLCHGTNNSLLQST